MGRKERRDDSSAGEQKRTRRCACSQQRGCRQHTKKSSWDPRRRGPLLPRSTGHEGGGRLLKGGGEHGSSSSKQQRSRPARQPVNLAGRRPASAKTRRRRPLVRRHIEDQYGYSGSALSIWRRGGGSTWSHRLKANAATWFAWLIPWPRAEGRPGGDVPSGRQAGVGEEP